MDSSLSVEPPSTLGGHAIGFSYHRNELSVHGIHFFFPGLDEVISSNQGAFIPKRGIAETILLAQEIVCDYHKEKGVPRCTLKVD